MLWGCQHFQYVVFRKHLVPCPSRFGALPVRCPDKLLDTGLRPVSVPVLCGLAPLLLKAIESNLMAHSKCKDHCRETMGGELNLAF